MRVFDPQRTLVRKGFVPQAAEQIPLRSDLRHAYSLETGTPCGQQRLLSSDALARVSALEDERMNLLRSICCVFAGGCGLEEPKPTKETVRGEPPVSEGDLARTEAELEKTGKEKMSHMEGRGGSKGTY